MPTEVSDRNVFILGAGFSASAGAPLVNDFLDVSREIFDNPGQDLDETERKLFGQVFEFKIRVAQSREKFVIDLDNIEQLFGLIEMSHRLERKTDVRDAMVYVIAKTLQLAIAKNQRKPVARIGPAPGYEKSNPSWFQSLPHESPTVALPDIYTHFALLLSGKYDVPNKSRSNTVITFNYDLILDDALRRVGVEPMYGLPNTDSEEAAPQPENGVSLLKLHGSTNWAICSKCKKVHVAGSKFTGDPSGFRAKPCTKCRKPGLRLLLVPPSWDKSEYSGTMRPVWQEAVNALKTANRICVIGYSMPETDTFFKYLLTLGLAENHQLYRFILVDKSPQQFVGDLTESEPTVNIEARYRSMFEKLFVRRRFEFFGNGFTNFLANIGFTMGRAETVAIYGFC